MGDVLYYQGSFVQDKMEGPGYLFLKDGKVFSGTFKNNQPNGPGQLLNEGLKQLDDAANHEDLRATVMKQVFIVDSAARRYNLEIPENTHLNPMGAFGTKLSASKRLIQSSKIRSKLA